MEKSTLDINRKGIQPRWMKSASPSSRIELNRDDAMAPQDEAAPQAVICSLDGDCEACQ